MLPDLHAALRTLIYEVGQISPLEVDVLFEPPSRDRFDRLTRPAVSLYLSGVRENLDLRDTSFSTTRGGAGAQRRMPARRVDFVYMVSMLSTEVDDEFRLLWRVLATLMKYQKLPPELLSPELRSIEPAIVTRVLVDEESQHTVDIWSALNMPPHPSFSYIVTAPMDLDMVITTPLVLTSTLRARHPDSDVVEGFIHIGGVLRTKGGVPVVGATVTMVGSTREGSISDEEGRFRIYRAPAGELRLAITDRSGGTKPATITVPSDSYEIKLE